MPVVIIVNGRLSMMESDCDCICYVFGCRMKVVAAYLLALLGGNTTPSAEDLKKILGSGMPSSI